MGWTYGVMGETQITASKATCTGPYGACASTVRTRTCLRTPVEFYDHCTWPVRVPVMTLSAHTGYWPRTIVYVPSTGKKRCACTTFRHGLLTGIRGLYGSARYAVRSPTGHWNFGPYGARKLPGSSMWPRQFNCTSEDNDKSTESQLLSSEVFQYTSPVSLQSVPPAPLEMCAVRYCVGRSNVWWVASLPVCLL